MNVKLLSRGVWLTLLVVSVLFAALAIKSFDTLSDLDEILRHVEEEGYRDQLKSNLRGGKTACVLGIIVVVLFSALSFALTWADWLNEKLVNGILYGVLLMASLYSSAFMILVGNVLQANNLTVEDLRGGGTQRYYEFCFILAYAMTAVYACLFVFYLWRRVSLSPSLQGNEMRSMGMGLPETRAAM